jgi:hypothetical protein
LDQKMHMVLVSPNLNELDLIALRISRQISFNTSSTWLSNTARRYLAGQTKWYNKIETLWLFLISLLMLLF